MALKIWFYADLKISNNEMKLNKIKTGFSTKMKFTLEVFLMNMYILHDVCICKFTKYSWEIPRFLSFNNKHSKLRDSWVSVNLFVSSAPFLYPLKTVFWCFQVVEKGCIGSKRINWRLHSKRWKVVPSAPKYCLLFSNGTGFINKIQTHPECSGSDKSLWYLRWFAFWLRI